MLFSIKHPEMPEENEQELDDLSDDVLKSVSGGVGYGAADDEKNGGTPWNTHSKTDAR